MTETPEIRLKRLAMRAGHRGMREADLILGGFARAQLLAGDLDAFEALLAESDPDILDWVLGRAAPPPRHAAMVARISQAASTLWRDIAHQIRT